MSGGVRPIFAALIAVSLGAAAWSLAPPPPAAPSTAEGKFALRVDHVATPGQSLAYYPEHLAALASLKSFQPATGPAIAGPALKDAAPALRPTDLPLPAKPAIVERVAPLGAARAPAPPPRPPYLRAAVQAAPLAPAAAPTAIGEYAGFAPSEGVRRSVQFAADGAHAVGAGASAVGQKVGDGVRSVGASAARLSETAAGLGRSVVRWFGVAP